MIERLRDMFGGGTPGKAPEARQPFEQLHGTLTSIQEHASGRARQVLDNVSYQRGKAGGIPGQEDEGVWLELAVTQLNNALEEIDRKVARGVFETSIAQDKAELQRVRQLVKSALAMPEQRAA